VAIATLAIGYVLVNTGLTRLKQTSIAPKQAIETLKETASWQTRKPA
jgi:hypothetical protein